MLLANKAVSSADSQFCALVLCSSGLLGEDDYGNSFLSLVYFLLAVALPLVSLSALCTIPVKMHFTCE